MELSFDGMAFLPYGIVWMILMGLFYDWAWTGVCEKPVFVLNGRDSGFGVVCVIPSHPRNTDCRLLDSLGLGYVLPSSPRARMLFWSFLDDTTPMMRSASSWSPSLLLCAPLLSPVLGNWARFPILFGISICIFAAPLGVVLYLN